MGKHRFAFFLFSLISFFIALNGYVMAQPAKKQLEAFRSAKTVRIVVEQSYGAAENISLEFEEQTGALIEYAGLKAVKEDAEVYDVTIKIIAKGNALGATYSGGVGHRYTGGSLSGSISFQAQGVQGYEIDFSGRNDISNAASSRFSKTPAKHNFYQPFRESFVKEMIEIMGEVYGTDFLLAALNDSSRWYVKRYAAEVLGKRRDPYAVEPLIDTLQDESVRRYAILALGKIGDSRAFEPLIDAFFKGKSTRFAAADALGDLGDLRAVEPLIEALKTKEYRLGAIFALGELGDFRAVEPLINALESEEEWHRDAAEEALGSMTGENFSQDQEKWQKWWVENQDKYLKK